MMGTRLYCVLSLYMGPKMVYLINRRDVVLVLLFFFPCMPKPWVGLSQWLKSLSFFPTRLMNQFLGEVFDRVY